ncbi:MAG: hypothetical protein ACJ8J0_28550 [Longimicrobiaceae bacterium]
MKKLRLELDELEVESFSTLADEKKRATVEGQEVTAQWNSECCPQSASVPVACICASAGEPGDTCETTCNPNDCFTCNGGWSCADCTATCPRRC